MISRSTSDMELYSDFIDTFACSVFATVSIVGTVCFIINLGNSWSLALIG